MNDNLPTLPEPAKKEAWQSTKNQKWIRGVNNFYSEDQMTEYGKLCRQQALEDAAKALQSFGYSAGAVDLIKGMK